MLEYGRSLRGSADASAPSRRRRPLTASEARSGNLLLELGATCWQGGKEMQEDRYILDMQLQSSDGHAVVGFCVLDGHSGSRCVDHLVEKLPANLQACLSKKPRLTEEHLRQAVLEACANVDHEFLIRARHLEMMDGSTLILGLVFPDLTKPGGAHKLLIANVGDSRAVLCRVQAGADPEIP